MACFESAFTTADVSGRVLEEAKEDGHGFQGQYPIAAGGGAHMLSAKIRHGREKFDGG